MQSPLSEEDSGEQPGYGCSYFVLQKCQKLLQAAFPGKWLCCQNPMRTSVAPRPILPRDVLPRATFACTLFLKDWAILIIPNTNEDFMVYNITKDFCRSKSTSQMCLVFCLHSLHPDRYYLWSYMHLMRSLWMVFHGCRRLKRW